MTRRSGKSSVLIVGGGIGGLTAGAALAQAGVGVTVLERSAFSDETGAGIQLGPNATRALAALGALEAIEAHAFRPEALWLFDARTGKRLATMPLGSELENRYGAPYLTLHRADLHAVLLKLCQENASLQLRSGFAVTAVEDQGGSITARGADGPTAEASMLIAADGLWSTLRRHVAPHAVPRATGQTAWRARVPRAGLPSPFGAPVVGLWLGPGAHLVHYPVRSGHELNLVAVVDGCSPAPDAGQGGWNQRGWSERADRAEFLEAFADWAKAPQSLLEMAESWRGWSLHRLAPLRQWSTGRLALLGDAAHPMRPFLAQGAALAIEDAVTLAGCLQASGGDPLLAFPRYAAMRRQRVRRVQRLSARLGRLYHLGAPLRFARNLALRSRRPESLLGGFDWLYGAKNLKP